MLFSDAVGDGRLGRLGRQALVVAAAAVLLGALSTAAPAQGQQDDLIVRSVGDGFVELEIPAACTPDPGGEARAFRSDNGVLCILRTGELSSIEIGLMVQVATDFGGIDLGINPVEPSAGEVFDVETPNPVYVFAFGAGPYLYTFQLAASNPTYDPRRLLAGLAQEHVALVSGLSDTEPPVTADPTSPESAAITSSSELGSLFVDVPGFRRAAGPVDDVHLVGTEGLPAGDVATALTRDTDSVLQFYETTGELLIGVAIFKYRFPLFAAAVLGDSEALGDGFDEIEDASSIRDGLLALESGSGGRQGAAFRKGRLFYFVTSPAGVEDVQEAAYAVRDLAVALYDAAPTGATSAFVFPSPAEAAGQSLLLVAVLGLAIVAVRASSARRAHGLKPVPRRAGVMAIDPQAAAIRKRGRILFLVQFTAIATLVIGVTVLQGAAAVGAIAVGFGLGFAATQQARRVALHQVEGRPKARPSVRGLALGGLAFAVLAVGLGLFLRGTRVSLFRPTLAHLELSNSTGIGPAVLGFGIAAVGLLLLVAGSPLYRAARRAGRATASRLRLEDDRPEILYLRSFDDDLLPIRTTFSERRPFLESFSISASEPFEESVAWQVSVFGPVTAVGQPDRPLSSLGAAREHLGNEQWREHVGRRIDEAQLILVVVARTDGLNWEVSQVAQQGHLGKTVFVVPPLSLAELEERWQRVLGVLSNEGIEVDDSVDLAGAISATLRDDGSVVAFGARLRDEAAYRAGVDAAIGQITGQGI